MSSDGGNASNPSCSGFLYGFIESSVVMPSDGLNGDCVVHYGSQHSGYTMHAKLLNGKREGAALIVDDGVPYINVVYERGVMTGNVERMNKNEGIELKGRLLNGIEDRLFVEYDENGRVK